MNQNWFNAMVEFGNTVKAVQRNFNVPSFIAKQIQNVAALNKSQVHCEAIAKASFELRNQVGF